MKIDGSTDQMEDLRRGKGVQQRFNMLIEPL